MIAHGIDGSRARALWRALAVVMILVAVVALTAPGARATEEVAPGAGEGEEERLTYDELEQSASQRAQEFFPDPYQEPSFFQWLSFPILLAGLAMTGVLLAAYLWWQPRFAAERRAKRRR